MNRKNFIGTAVLLVIFCFVLITAGWAGQFPVITSKELKAKLDTGEKILLLNPLSDIEFNEGHIPGSVNIPIQEIATTGKLPQDKDTLIITYCLGPK